MAISRKTTSKRKSSFRSKKAFTFLQAGLVAIVVALVGLRLLRPSSAVSGDHAKCFSISTSATSVKPHQTFTGQIKMVNDGSTTWKAFDYGFIDPYNTWNFTGNIFHYDHAPDGKTVITLSLKLTASSHTGTYNFGARIGSQAKPSGFDSPCPVIRIKVANPVIHHPQPHPNPTPNPRPPIYVPVPVPDKTPPSKPGNLSGSIDTTTKLVTLTWDASKDNKGVAGYQVERSVDKHKWKVLAKKNSDTSYEDSTADFGKHYYYRVKALDQAGNSSPYATTDVTSNSFDSNVSGDADSQIASEDNVVTVTIPAGATSSQLFCSVSHDPNTSSPTIAGYSAISEPYILSCRDSTGLDVTQFSKSLSAKVQLSKDMLNGVGSVAYFGQKDDSWQPLKLTAHDKKNLVDQVDLADYQTFAIMGKAKTKSPLGGIILILVFLLAIGFGVVFFLRWKARSQLQKQYDDYRKRSIGG